MLEVKELGPHGAAPLTAALRARPGLGDRTVVIGFDADALEVRVISDCHPSEGRIIIELRYR
jgi:hypothetical protein